MRGALGVFNLQVRVQPNFHVALASLRRVWALVLIAFVLVLSATFVLLTRLMSPQLAVQWVMQATIVSTIQLILLWLGLEKNRQDQQSPLKSDIGAGNTVTLVRGLLLSMVAGFLFIPWPDSWLAWVPSLLYAFTVIADYLDGYVARITNNTTQLGAYLDMEYDVLGMIIAPLLAVWYGQLPMWYLAASGLRYMFVVVKWAYKNQDKQLHEINDSLLRRMVAGVQMIFVFIVLAPVYQAPETHIAAGVVLVPLILSFGRDLLVMTGQLDVTSNLYNDLANFINTWVFGKLAALLRIITVGSLVMLLVAYGDVFSTLTALSLMMISGLLLSGTITRLAAIAAALMVGLIIQVVGLNGVTITILVGSLLLLVTGGGRWVLWQPEDAFFLQRGGTS